MDILIKNADVLLSNGFCRTDVYIDGGIIAAVGTVPDGNVPKRIIDGTGRLLIPGLVNAHTHTYMTLFRNRADDLDFADWLFGNILPLEDNLTEEDCYWGSLLACMEMLRTGTTAFLDMYIFTDAAAAAAKQAGMRAVLSRGLTGGADDVAGGERRLREATDEIKKWKNTENLSFMLAPHAPYTCDEGYLREVAAASKTLGVGLHTHIAESEDETDTIRKNYGCTPAELMYRAGILTNRTVAAHCVRLTESDMELFTRSGASIATNPLSNMKLGNGFAPVERFLDHGINVALGTDGAASSNSLNMFRSLAALTLIHKGTSGNAKAVSAAEGIKIVTSGGANALGINTGSIEAGKIADLVLINTDVPSLKPLHDPIAALSYSADGTETETIIIGGKEVYHKGEYAGIDQDEVYRNIEKICVRMGIK